MTTKEVEIRFDFIAPEHCSEIGARNTCSYGVRPIDVGNDITEVNKVSKYLLSYDL
jgi:hypothetical protein